jgi:hypothetical protein
MHAFRASANVVVTANKVLYIIGSIGSLVYWLANK